MNYSAALLFVLAVLAPPAQAEDAALLDPLPCGIYDESVKALTEKNIETQAPDPAARMMEIVTRSSRTLSVDVKSVRIKMPGERNHVSVLLDGKLFVKTSHQDVPLYLEVHVDNERYRIICVRVDEKEILPLEAETKRKQENGSQQEKSSFEEQKAHPVQNNLSPAL